MLVTKIANRKEQFIDIDNQYPKLFSTFPLIGTEELGIPFIINSTSFELKTERNGIYLKDSNDNVEKNKKLILESLEAAISIFPEIIRKKNIKNVFNIFNFSNAKYYDWLDVDWLNKLKTDIVLKLNEKECIPTNEEWHKFSDLHIPYSQKEDLRESIFNLLKGTNSYNVISCFAELPDWISVAEQHAKLRGIDILKIENIVARECMIKYVEEKKTLEELKDDLNIDEYDWLNKLYTLINEELGIFPQNKELLPNQEGYLEKAESLFWDDIKDKDLKNISNNLGLNFPKILISNDIKRFKIKSDDNYSKEEAVKKLKHEINECEYLNKEELEANALFLKWLIKEQKTEIIKDLKIISFETNSDKEKDSKSVRAEIFKTGKHRILAPKKTLLEMGFPLYSEIIREKDCMHPIYNEILTATDFKWLDKVGEFIHYSPLVKRTEKLDKSHIETLIKDSDELKHIIDEEGKVSSEIELEFSDFAYLTSSEEHIYHRNSSIKLSKAIFKFLLKEAIKDEYIDAKETIKDINGESIVFKKALWLQRAKNIQWVYTRNIGTGDGKSKNSGERPSTKNIAELIKGDLDLEDCIKGETQRKFFDEIGVGADNLMINLLDPDEKAHVVETIMSLKDSGMDMEYIKEICNDTKIRDEYEKRKKDTKLIKRNQEIGKLVEELFEKLIESEKKINIERETYRQ